MSLKLNGATSGSIELDVPDAIGSDLNITIPATAGEVAVKATDGSVDLGDVNIDSSGRLLVGTSSSTSSNRCVVQGAMAGAGGQFGIARNNNNPGASDGLANLNFTTSLHETVAQIQVARDGGTWTASTSYPTALKISTTADGASSPTERMRITNAGIVGIGITNPTGSFANGNGVQFFPSGVVYSNRTSNASASFGRNTSTGDVVIFAYGTAATNPGQVGSVSVTASATAFNTSSDYRLKENVKPVTDSVTRLQQLKPSRFNFIAEPDKTVDGFIAHEVQTIVPEAITGEKDAVDDEGNPIYQGIDQSKLVPLLTAALQEAIAKIETLEAKVAALEANP